MLKDLCGRTGLDDATSLHDGNPVRHVAYDAKVVGNEQIRHAGFGLQIAQQIQNLRLYGHIQRRCRLIADQDIRIDGQGARNRNPLTLTAGKFVRITVQCIGIQTNTFQQCT